MKKAEYKTNLIWEGKQLSWMFEGLNAHVGPVFGQNSPAETDLEDYFPIGSMPDAAPYDPDFVSRMGFRVLDVAMETQNLVEADYGAPGKGLEFFQDLIDPRRMYRYTPVSEHRGLTVTHKEQAEAIAASLKIQGYHTFKDTQGGSENLCFWNGGVTRAYAETLKLIVGSFMKAEALRTKFNLYQSGAFLVPKPTYGLFLNLINEIAAENSAIKVLFVHRKASGAVDPRSLTMQLEYCAENNIQPLAYYDSNPNNPTGYIREEEETSVLGRIILDFVQSFRKAHLFKTLIDNDLYMETDGYELYRYASSVFSGVVLIDDMVYEGLELYEERHAASFAQVDSEIASHTVVLKGLSKIGLPGLRIGMAVGPEEIIRQHVKRLVRDEFMANTLGVDLLVARYCKQNDPRFFEKAYEFLAHGRIKANPHGKFLAHLENLRELHVKKRNLVEALFLGIENVRELNAREKHKIISSYARHAGLRKIEAAKTLSRGLPSIRIMNHAEAGFFIGLDFSAYKDRQILLRFGGKKEIFSMKLNSSHILKYALEGYGIRAVPGHAQGYPSSALIARISTSIEDKELFRLFDGLRAMEHYFLGPKPQIQPDLFRDYARYPV